MEQEERRKHELGNWSWICLMRSLFPHAVGSYQGRWSLDKSVKWQGFIEMSKWECEGLLDVTQTMLKESISNIQIVLATM